MLVKKSVYVLIGLLAMFSLIVPFSAMSMTMPMKALASTEEQQQQPRDKRDIDIEEQGDSENDAKMKKFAVKEGGKTTKEKGFRIEPNNVLVINENDKVHVTEDLEEGQTFDRALITDSKDKEKKVPITGDGVVDFKGFKEGAYTLDVVIKDGNRKIAYECVVVVAKDKNDEKERDKGNKEGSRVSKQITINKKIKIIEKDLADCGRGTTFNDKTKKCEAVKPTKQPTPPPKKQGTGGGGGGGPSKGTGGGGGGQGGGGKQPPKPPISCPVPQKYNPATKLCEGGGKPPVTPPPPPPPCKPGQVSTKTIPCTPPITPQPPVKDPVKPPVTPKPCAPGQTSTPQNPCTPPAPPVTDPTKPPGPPTPKPCAPGQQSTPQNPCTPPPTKPPGPPTPPVGGVTPPPVGDPNRLQLCTQPNGQPGRIGPGGACGPLGPTTGGTPPPTPPLTKTPTPGPGPAPVQCRTAPAQGPSNDPPGCVIGPNTVIFQTGGAGATPAPTPTPTPLDPSIGGGQQPNGPPCTTADGQPGRIDTGLGRCLPVDEGTAGTSGSAGTAGTAGNATEQLIPEPTPDATTEAPRPSCTTPDGQPGMMGSQEGGGVTCVPISGAEQPSEQLIPEPSTSATTADNATTETDQPIAELTPEPTPEGEEAGQAERLAGGPQDCLGPEIWDGEKCIIPGVESADPNVLGTGEGIDPFMGPPGSPAAREGQGQTEQEETPAPTEEGEPVDCDLQPTHEDCAPLPPEEATSEEQTQSPLAGSESELVPPEGEAQGTAPIEEDPTMLGDPTLQGETEAGTGTEGEAAPLNCEAQGLVEEDGQCVTPPLDCESQGLVEQDGVCVAAEEPELDCEAQGMEEQDGVCVFPEQEQEQESESEAAPEFEMQAEPEEPEVEFEEPQQQEQEQSFESGGEESEGE